MLVGPDTPQEVLTMTQTEREVTAYAGRALIAEVFEIYGRMWSG